MMARTMLVAGLVLGLGHIHAAIVGTADIATLQAGVVRITATPSGGPQKVGTGFIVRLERDVVYIVTAAHVIAGDVQPKVQFFTQQDLSVQATVKHSEGGDEVTGLALLIVRGKDKLPSGLTALTLASASHLSGNEEIIVMGHPRGAGDWAIIKGGIASRQGRYLTVDANIDEGNSGGPIIQKGEVVGLIGGVTRYGRGVTNGSVREYLEGHGINIAGSPPEAVAKVQPTPGILRRLELQDEDKDINDITNKSFARMALIPAGEFWMGSPKNEGTVNEHPRHQIYLDAYSMDISEVTIARHAEFLRSTGRRVPNFWDLVKAGTPPDHPVVEVDWHDAEAYCRWAGKRLPTEAEWEKAARGTDERIYPWGNEQPTSRLGNFATDQGPFTVESFMAGESPYGLLHMAGNVWEWTADWYDEHSYAKSPQRNPKGPSSGTSKVIRGGSWSSEPGHVRSAYRGRAIPAHRDGSIGFRCAQDSPK